MLKPPLSPNSKRAKRRKLLSLNRPHSITPKLLDDTTTPFPQSSSRNTTSPPPIPSNQDTVDSPTSRLESTNDTMTTTSTTTFDEYYCPICNKDLSPLNTSYGRQLHIDECLSSGTIDEDSHFGLDDQYLDLFMDYCSFCGKSISHLKGIHKERHFDQCLTSLETEQQLAEQHQQLTTYAGHSIPFLQNLDICPVCHNTLPGPNLRKKISHIKRCAKQRSLTMDQLLRKIQWMQWGHLPIQNSSSSSSSSAAAATSDTSSSSSSSSSFPISYTRYATELPSNNSNSIATTTRSTPSLTINKRPADTTVTNFEDADDDFSTNVLVYKIASYRQTRFNKGKVEPTEDESIAMALSLSLMSEEEQRLSSKRGGSKKKKEKVDLNEANIVSIEESRVLAKLALEKMLARRYSGGDSSFVRFPLVTSHVQPAPQRLPTGQRSTSSTSLWAEACFSDSI